MSFDGRYSPCIISLSNLDRCRRRGAETRQRRATAHAEVDGRTREREREREREKERGGESSSVGRGLQTGRASSDGGSERGA